MSDRPKSNDVYKKQGLKAKEREKALAADDPKAAIEAAKKSLRREVLRYANGNLRRSFDAFSEGLDIQFLLGFVGMEMVRLQSSLGDGEAPDFRYTAAMVKYMEQLRKLLLIQSGQASFIPDEITVLLETEDSDDVSDRPEFT